MSGVANVDHRAVENAVLPEEPSPVFSKVILAPGISMVIKMLF